MILSFKEKFVVPIISGEKIHTIRKDRHQRWSPGVVLHMATGVRTKDYNCFSGIHTVKAIQNIFIAKKIHKNQHLDFYIIIDGKCIPKFEIQFLAQNDGFDNDMEFVNFFVPGNEGIYTGRLIHWTNTLY